MDCRTDLSSIPISAALVDEKGVYTGHPLTVNGFQCVRVAVDKSALNYIVNSIIDKLNLRNDRITTLWRLDSSIFGSYRFVGSSIGIGSVVYECCDSVFSEYVYIVDICPDGFFYIKRDTIYNTPPSNENKAIDLFCERYDTMNMLNRKPVKLPALLVYARIKGPRAILKPKYL